MSRPIVVVLGSLDQTREYEYPLQDPAAGIAAAEQVGAELARTGHDLVVFSSDPSFIEAHVIRGYISEADASSRIHLRAPQDQQEELPASPRLPHLVVHQPSPSTDWEFDYFRSLLTADGVVMFGGGRGTRTAGIIAQAREIPMAAIAAFGGGARAVWRSLTTSTGDLTQTDIDLTGSHWDTDKARRIVASLVAQRERRAARQAHEARAATLHERARTVNNLVALICLTIAVATVPLLARSADGTNALALLLAGALAASVAGALLRNSFAGVTSNWFQSAVHGLGAGTVSVLLYVATQLLTTTADLTSAAALSRLSYLLVPLGMAAGLTFDAVYAQLKAPKVRTPQGSQPALEVIP